MGPGAIGVPTPKEGEVVAAAPLTDTMTQTDPSLNSSSLAFVEELYLAYLDDPGSVSESWRGYFERYPANGELSGRESLEPHFERRTLFNPAGGNGVDAAEAGSSAAEFQQRVDKLVRNYRVRGHRIADLNPLGRDSVDIPEIEPGYYGFGPADLARSCFDCRGTSQERGYSPRSRPPGA